MLNEWINIIVSTYLAQNLTSIIGSCLSKRMLNHRSQFSASQTIWRHWTESGGQRLSRVIFISQQHHTNMPDGRPIVMQFKQEYTYRVVHPLRRQKESPRAPQLAVYYLLFTTKHSTRALLRALIITNTYLNVRKRHEYLIELLCKTKYK